VLAKVADDIGQTVADLAGGGERAGVVAVAPEGAAAVKGAVGGAGGADGESTEAAAQGRLVVGLDDHVDVIALDREVEKAEVEAARG
jgi:hypothetical protein